MNPETPLETAQRLWPGEWTEHGGNFLHRVLFADDPHFRMSACLYYLGEGRWIADGGTPGLGWTLARGDIEHVLTTARDRVQTMARDFARAAGLP